MLTLPRDQTHIITVLLYGNLVLPLPENGLSTTSFSYLNDYKSRASEKGMLILNRYYWVILYFIILLNLCLILHWLQIKELFENIYVNLPEKKIQLFERKL